MTTYMIVTGAIAITWLICATMIFITLIKAYNDANK